MPDLTRQAYWLCRSAEYWERQVASKSGGAPHVVRWSRHGHKNSGVQFDWSCDCKGYRLGKGQCSHIRQVAGEGGRCGWHQFTDGGTPVYKDGKPTCPQCGGPVSAEDWAV
jgi:hypothetical protein